MRARLDQRNHRLGNLGRHVIANAVGAEGRFVFFRFIAWPTLAKTWRRVTLQGVAIGQISTVSEVSRALSLARLPARPKRFDLRWAERLGGACLAMDTGTTLDLDSEVRQAR